jgi:hypothetical protein
LLTFSRTTRGSRVVEDCMGTYNHTLDGSDHPKMVVVTDPLAV